MTKINSFNKAFIIKIQSLYDIENQLVIALPKLAKYSTNPDLKEGFEMHLEETKEHIKRLEKIFEMLDEKPHKTKVEGIRGIIDDSSWIMTADVEDNNLRDVMLASSARYAEHYEMAGYMSAILEAETLKMPEAVDLLTETLEEEQVADESLAECMKMCSMKVVDGNLIND
jgi:ferritin-like metal-binding protein YciE